MCDKIDIVSRASELQNQTNFTADQLIDFVQKFLDYKCFVDNANLIVAVSFSVSGSVGFLAYILMFASLNHLSISPCTMIYHKAIVLFELPHMIIMVENGLIQLFAKSIPNSYSYVTWRSPLNTGWHFGDWAKLSISTLTAFLTLERCVACCFPAKFDKINRTIVAYAAVLLSVFAGSAHAWAIFTKKIEFSNQTDQYISNTTDFSYNKFYLFTLNFINAAKIGLCFFIFALCLATALTLKNQAKKLASMSNNAKEDWKVKKRVCAFSYIIGICVLIDHTMWVIFKVTQQNLNPRASPSKSEKELLTNGNSFEEANYDVYYAKIVHATFVIQVFTGQIVHSWRFFIYLALNQSMRNAFKRVLPKRNSNQVQSVPTITLHTM